MNTEEHFQQIREEINAFACGLNVLLFFAATVYGMFVLLANYANIALIDILCALVVSSLFFGIAGAIIGLFLQAAIRLIGHTIVDIVELFRQPEKN